MSLVPCGYYKRTGVVSGRNCYGGRCYTHKGKTGHVLCSIGCGRMTRSATVICKSCGWLQASAANRIARDRKKAESDMDVYITNLITNWRVYDDAAYTNP